MAKELSEQMLIAIREYMKGKPKAVSLLTAGYAKSTAYDHPEQVFDHPAVKAEIQRRRDEVERKATINVNYILEKLEGIVEDETVSHANKLRALEMLAKHLGMLTDRLQVNVEEDIVRRIQAGRERVAAARRQLEAEADEQTDHPDGDNPIH